MRAPRSLRPLLASVLDVAWPTDCFVCGLPLGLGQCCGACLPCWARLRPLPGTCPRCGEPTAASDLERPPGLPCARCLLSPTLPSPGPTASLCGVLPAVAYDGTARRFLLRAKAGGHAPILPLLGAQLAARLRASSFAAGCGAVVPVPSHWRARLRRGFDPAHELARPVARALGVPLVRALRRRWSAGGTAKRLRARARARALAGAFSASAAPLPARILLVDDVLTTGATAAACAEALRAAGVEEVRTAVWARTPRGAPV